MCIATPMQVLDAQPGRLWAWCDDGGERHRVDMLLVGDRPVGSWVLVFLGAAREPMEQGQALRVRDALAALHAAAEGRGFDHLFPDLVGREPQLPEHLRRA